MNGELRLRVTGLFAGIGGFELGFQQAGYETKLLAEIDEECRSVLESHFRSATIARSIFDVDELPDTDVVTAGFPCQPFSQAGKTKGIESSRHLLAKFFSLLSTPSNGLPAHVVLENVANIVYLDKGAAIQYIVDSFELLGYSWAYRIIDSSSFGLPQRRARWFFIASLADDAASILFKQDITAKQFSLSSDQQHAAHGFYWTEGNTGLGWANDAIPPLKGGSTVGIPSPPAIWNIEEHTIVTPTVRDAERLQGLPADWTRLETQSTAAAHRRRWRMIGNAVSVPVSRWLASGIAARSSTWKPDDSVLLTSDARWPRAAYGHRGLRRSVGASRFPFVPKHLPILDFLEDEPHALSARATLGFTSRLRRSTLRYPREFLTALELHERRVNIGEAQPQR